MQTPVQDLIDEVHSSCVGDLSGEILRGIPPLEAVDPDSFGVCLATTDGHVYEAGDTRLDFSIQSISKPFTYGIALADRGVEAVGSKVEVEPSGELYNEISLDPLTHRPRNPMINAGALVAASLVRGDGPDEQSERIAAVLSAYAGRELRIDEEILRAQLEVGHRNRAIGHMLREFGILEGDPDIPHEVYLRACSTMLDCRDLALMGATWANGGVQPITGEQVISTALTERVLSVMSTCGMYDAAGAWVAEVGMAAKSGVGGGIVAVLPGQVAIAAFSPRLDARGNSVRAFRACRQLSRSLELHAMHAPRSRRNAIRDVYDVLEAPSSLQRPEVDRKVLERHGHKARVYELHGDLLFAGAESVIRELCAAGSDLEFLVLDVRRISDVAAVSRRLLTALRAWLEQQGCEGFLIDPDGTLPEPDAEADIRFPTIAAATAYLEDRILERHGVDRQAETTFSLADHPGLAAAAPAVLEEVRRLFEPRSYAAGEPIALEGDVEAGAFVLVRGRGRSTLRTADGGVRPLATLTPGACFGHVAVATGLPHPVSVEADGPAEALELTRASFEGLEAGNPEVRAAVLELFIHSVQDVLDRSLRALAHGRVAPTAG